MRLWGKILARVPNAQMKIKGMKGCMRGSKSDAAREYCIYQRCCRYKYRDVNAIHSVDASFIVEI
jgi:hypothetical protein